VVQIWRPMRTQELPLVAVVLLLKATRKALRLFVYSLFSCCCIIGSRKHCGFVALVGSRDASGQRLTEF
jgi:hypothetical protein